MDYDLVDWIPFLSRVLLQKESLRQELGIGGRSFAEAWTSNMVDWKFCSNSIFETNLTLL